MDELVAALTVRCRFQAQEIEKLAHLLDELEAKRVEVDTLGLVIETGNA